MKIACGLSSTQSRNRSGVARRDGSLDFCNAQWRSYMGFTQEELQGEGWQSMLHPDDRQRVLNAWRESVANGTLYEQEERHRQFDGQYRWFLARGVPLRDSAGGIVRWYGTNTDIQDLKEAEDRLRESRAELVRAARIATMGELTALIAHEINQPLAAVAADTSAVLRWLAVRPPNLDEVREAANGAVREVNRASRVIERIRALLANKLPQLRPLDVNKVIREVLALAHSELMTAGVAVHTDAGRRCSRRARRPRSVAA